MPRSIHGPLIPGLLALAAVTTACGAPGDAPPPSAETTTASPAGDGGTSQPPPEEALFVDVAADSGLDFEHWNGMTGELYYAEMMGSGAALFDYDGDGDLDVYLVQGNLLGDHQEADATFPPPGPLPLTDRLFRNDLEVLDDGSRRLRFTDVTAESGITATGYGMGATAADFDNDGWTDLYVTNLGRNQLFRNLGRGDDGKGDDGRVTFEEVTDDVTGIRRWSVPAAAADLDRDGWLDLYVGNYVAFSAATNKRCTDELGTPNYCGPLAFQPEPDNLLRNLGREGIAFEDVSVESGIRGEHGGCLGVLATDLDGDRRPDVYVGNDGLPNQLWCHADGGALRFENRALLAGAAVNGQGQPEASMGMTAGDVDGDGDHDLFVAHLTRETNTLYRNDGRGVFTDASAPSGLGAPSWHATGFGAGFFDYDNDGRLDLLVVNGAVKIVKEQALAGDPHPLHQRNQLFHQLPDGTFEEVTGRAGAVFDLSEVSRGAAFGDLDDDGDVDVVVTNNAGPVRLLQNRVGQDRSWLGLRLTGAGGRDAIGAEATLRLADGRTLTRRVVTSWSYASSNDPRLLFGLGDDGGDEVAEVVVAWPDGSRERWRGLATGGYTTLRQGAGEPVEGER